MARWPDHIELRPDGHYHLMFADPDHRGGPLIEGPIDVASDMRANESRARGVAGFLGHGKPVIETRWVPRREWEAAAYDEAERRASEEAAFKRRNPLGGRKGRLSPL